LGRCTVEYVSGEQRNIFLPKPRWRTRAGPVSLWAAIVLTFVVFLAIGGTVFLFVVVLLDYADAPGWLVFSTWLVPTAAVTIWALRARVPATASDYEAQIWGAYALRAVMIGIERPRHVVARVATAVAFGAPLGMWIVVGVVLGGLGLM
jgi:hypothetical protein